MNLANALVDAGHKVVLWSTAFYHQEKRHRLHDVRELRISPQLEIRLISSPGYVRNIGPGRLWDHAVLGYRLKQRLKNETVAPDVAFVGYPPIEAAAVMTRWLTVRGVPSLLDVKDQWPTIFIKALPGFLAPLAKVALFPYFYLGRRAMREASGVSAMADGFLQWALDFAGRPRRNSDRVVPLTTSGSSVSESDLEAARGWWDSRGVLADGRARVCFVGSHSQAFDMAPVVDAVRLFSASGKPCEFVICGDGECSAEWRRLLAGFPNVVFAGWVSRPQIEVLAERSIAALAPYRNTPDFVMSVPNKVIDSLALGLPILSSLQGEVAHLIDAYSVGLSYAEDKERSLAQCIEYFVGDQALQRQFAQRALDLYNEKFSFENVYGGLVRHLEALASESRQA